MAVLTYNGNIIGKSSANDGVLTIQKNGNTVATFSANQSSNAIANILVPVSPSDIGAADASHTHTKSEITDFPTLGTASSKDVPSTGNASSSQVVMGNDTRLTDSRTASDVYDWAKASTKPSYTASEVGALASTTLYAGASTAGGAATSAAKLTNTSKVGDTNKPVYFTANGVPAAISYTIEKSVPSNAVFTDNNTTYTFTGGTNKFTVTPSGGTAQDVSVTPSITNNITGSGTSGYITKFNGTNTITNLVAIGTGTTKFLREDGSWATPAYPTVNNATLTIQKNGTNIDTFTANASSNKTINISVPTDGNYIARNEWWESGNGQNVDNAAVGAQFVYTTHGAPSYGELLTVAGNTSRDYNFRFQLQGSYTDNNLYFRVCDGNFNTWKNWHSIFRTPCNHSSMAAVLDVARMHYDIGDSIIGIYLLTIVDSAANYNTGIYTYKYNAYYGVSTLAYRTITFNAANNQGTVAFNNVNGNYNITVMLIGQY